MKKAKITLEYTLPELLSLVSKNLKEDKLVLQYVHMHNDGKSITFSGYIGDDEPKENKVKERRRTNVGPRKSGLRDLVEAIIIDAGACTDVYVHGKTKEEGYRSDLNQIRHYLRIVGAHETSLGTWSITKK